MKSRSEWKRFRAWVATGLGASAAGCLAAAPAPDFASGFAEANRLYEEAKFTEAVGAYSRLLETGHTSAALHFNLGNAAFRQQRLGLALAHYREAQQLQPRAADIRANLAATRSRLGRSSGPEPFWVEGLGRLTQGEWLALGTLTVWSAAALYLAAWRIPNLRTRLRPVLLPAAVIAALVATLATAALAARSSHRVGVSLIKDTKARYGPLDESKEAFSLPEGSEVRVREEQGKWLRVELPGQVRTGWVKREQVRRIGPG